MNNNNPVSNENWASINDKVLRLAITYADSWLTPSKHRTHRELYITETQRLCVNALTDKHARHEEG